MLKPRDGLPGEGASIGFVHAPEGADRDGGGPSCRDPPTTNGEQIRDCCRKGTTSYAMSRSRIGDAYRDGTTGALSRLSPAGLGKSATMRSATEPSVPLAHYREHKANLWLTCLDCMNHRESDLDAYHAPPRLRLRPYRGLRPTIVLSNAGGLYLTGRAHAHWIA